MSFCPYLSFAGNAREAMTFYAEVFGATDLEFNVYGDMPPGTPDMGMGPDKIMHAQFTLGSVPLMGSDAPGVGGGSDISVFHGATSKEAAKAVFDRLADGAEVTMPFGPTFWAPVFGMLKDRFGISWMITTAPNVT
jgi:PhnB protein